MSAAAPQLEWLTARDGSRTARDRATGALLGDCSVPRRAAEMMLRKLAVKGRVVCLLLPTHPHQIAVCLEKTDPTIGLIAIVHSRDTLATMQACCDDSSHTQRLFVAWDAASLRAIFDAHPGLPVPQQFIRLPVSDKPACDAAIVWTQQVFSEVTTIQNQRLERARSRSDSTGSTPLVVVSRTFQLWDDAGDRLARSLAADVLDTDDATQCATAHVADRASCASAIITADAGRADQPVLAGVGVPWISWITGARVPAFVRSSPRDGIVVADESLAQAAYNAGWPRDRVRVGRDAPVVHRGGESLVIAIDLPSLEAPAEIVEYSSWRVVWDAIAKELIDHPHRLAGDIDGYLERSRRHFGVPPDDFPRGVFVRQLVGPTYAIGIARWLVREGVPVSIHGRGWERVEGVVSHARGPVDSHESLEAILERSAGIVDVHVDAAHPSRRAGIPMLTTLGRTPQRVLQDARAMPKAASTPVHATQTLAAAIGSLVR
jgi:hypothetical protein